MLNIKWLEREIVEEFVKSIKVRASADSSFLDATDIEELTSVCSC